eukprot:scaffold2331_cov252-Pinguiococcus_pyrenoidosus.AAC.17
MAHLARLQEAARHLGGHDLVSSDPPGHLIHVAVHGYREGRRGGRSYVLVRGQADRGEIAINAAMRLAMRLHCTRALHSSDSERDNAKSREEDNSGELPVRFCWRRPWNSRE